ESLRERVHLAPQDAAALTLDLAAGGREALALGTCNRTELYVTASGAAEAAKAARHGLAQLGVGGQLWHGAYVYVDEDAVRHLFRVAAGLERDILQHVRANVPNLLDEPGVGPIVAAQLIVTWSHPRPAPLRSLLRSPGRRRTPTSLERPNDPPPAQPRRRPPAQPCSAHSDPPPSPTRPRHQGRHRPTNRPRQDRTRSDPHPQALPRPPPLPRHAKHQAADDLTVIGDSFRKAGTWPSALV